MLTQYLTQVINISLGNLTHFQHEHPGSPSSETRVKFLERFSKLKELNFVDEYLALINSPEEAKNLINAMVDTQIKLNFPAIKEGTFVTLFKHLLNRQNNLNNNTKIRNTNSIESKKTKNEERIRARPLASAKS